MVKRKIGRAVVSFGEFNPHKVGGYDTTNRCSLYGCEWESKEEGNEYPPASLVGGKVVPNTEHWSLVSGNPDLYGLDIDSKYAKPSGGIPKADLAETVQTSLGLADTALQSHQDISGKADKSEVYTKDQGTALENTVTNLSDSKANKSEVYTKDQGTALENTVTNLSDSKANKSEVYTKEQGESLSSNIDQTIEEIEAVLEEQNQKIEALTKDDVEVVDNHEEVVDPDPEKIYREPGENSYTDWQYSNGWKKLKKTSYPGVDEEPRPGSEKLISSGAVATAYGYYIDHPHFLSVHLDNDGKLIKGTYKDGTEFFAIGVNIADEYETHICESTEFLRVWLDNDNHILFGLQRDGDFVFGMGVPTQIVNYIQSVVGNRVEAIEETLAMLDIDALLTFYKIDNPEYSELTLDDEQKIISARRKDGTKVENVGIETPRIFIPGKDIDIIGKIEGLEKLGLMMWEGSHQMNIVTIKKDGTGDYTNIQEAINSITDATITNQYEIQVWDDYYINDLKELYQVNSPSSKSTDTPESFVAYIITKDFVHLRGMGGMREIFVESPDVNMPATCFQNIHPIFVMGNCRVENFIFKIKGGRYALHQDMSGYKFGVDSFKTTVYKNIKAIHLGNSMYAHGSGWTSTSAQANGVANGQKQIFINVTWDAHEHGVSFYCHTNDMYTTPCEVYILNCRYINRPYMKEIGNQFCHISDRYSCQNNTYYVINSDIPTFDGSYAMGAGSMGDGVFTPPTQRFTKKYCLNHVVGHGNKPVAISVRYNNVITFTTKALGSKIEVVGGTAKDDIFGNEMRNICGAGITGSSVGGNYIVSGQYSKVHSLPYILGNCQGNPKTLIVRITDSNNEMSSYAITFDKNYMTSDGGSYDYNTTPAISQQEILDKINEDFGSIFTVSDKTEYLNSFDDCIERIVNGGVKAVSRGDAMVRDMSDGYRTWRLAEAGENPEGFAAHKIAIGGLGTVLLTNNLFRKEVLNIGNTAKGTLYKVGNNGKLVSAGSISEATMIAVDSNVICKI